MFENKNIGEKIDIADELLLARECEHAICEPVRFHNNGYNTMIGWRRQA